MHVSLDEYVFALHVPMCYTWFDDHPILDELCVEVGQACCLECVCVCVYICVCVCVCVHEYTYIHISPYGSLRSNYTPSFSVLDTAQQ